AYTQSQLDQGIFSPETIAVGDLFSGALIPGLILVAAYAGYILFVAWRQPERVPGLTKAELAERPPITRLLLALAPPILLIVLVLGSIMMGFMLDFIEITFVVVPIVAPVLLTMGIDPVWLGVLLAVNLQTSFLTPPFGFSLFYLRGAAPASIETRQIYRGVLPFIAIQISIIGLLVLFPDLATWLPESLALRDHP
ncbi:MAG TPA: TRAP transporter large permease subunit, partial [Halothiobacillaceae bacterium]|nr:TRAP transporter large permease subunit [Halothiobacillaceae bacterium]